MNLNQKLARNLKKILRARSITAEKFGQEIGIAKGYIYEIVAGKRNITLDKLESIADGLKIKPTELLK